MSAAFLPALQQALPNRVVTDPAILEGYRRDQAGLVPAGIPAVLARATCTADVQAVLRIASAWRVPVVARGAGSGLSGGANAVDGCVVLDLSEMKRLAIDPAAMVAVVEPGVVNADLARAAAGEGLWYPPDPASYEFSTIGGNVATNAGGLCCVKYGVTRDSVLALEVVLADGSTLRTGHRTVKGVAGYDLTALFVGSEGTLAVITEVTLRLRPRPRPPATLVAFFASLASAGQAITAITRQCTPSLLEVMDHTTVRAVETWKPMGLDTDCAALLLATSDAGGDQGAAEILEMAAACAAAGATDITHSTDPADSAPFLTARRLAYPALERLGSTVLDDVAVPGDRLIDMLQTIERIAAENGVVIGTFGHAGDGNLHPTIVIDAAEPGSARAGQAAFAEIVRAALALGGTITGEHGVGLLKRGYLVAEAGPAGMAAHHLVKRAFDPLGILNPGKLL